MSGTGAAPDGKTALTLAAMFNRTEPVRLLLARGANPHARATNGMTALVPRLPWGAEHAGQLAALAIPPVAYRLL